MKKFFKVIPIIALLLLLLPTLKVKASTDVSCQYQVHVQNIGWMPAVGNGATAGTVGQGLAMQAIAISSIDPNIKLQYQVHVHNIGWMPVVTADGGIAGTVGQGLAMEAIAISVKDLKGQIATGYHISYRAYVQNIGWQNWGPDGSIAGTTGQNLAIEAIQIKIATDLDSLTLNINGVIQEKSNWCWAATSNCVSLYLRGTSPTQTQIVTAVKGSPINNPALPAEQVAALNYSGINTTYVDRALSATEIKDMIRGCYSPILAHIAWSDGGAHAVVIYGYSYSSQNYISYMDPWGDSNRFNSCTVDYFNQNSEFSWVRSFYKNTRKY